MLDETEAQEEQFRYAQLAELLLNDYITENFLESELNVILQESPLGLIVKKPKQGVPRKHGDIDEGSNLNDLRFSLVHQGVFVPSIPEEEATNLYTFDVVTIPVTSVKQGKELCFGITRMLEDLRRADVECWMDRYSKSGLNQFGDPETAAYALAQRLRNIEELGTEQGIWAQAQQVLRGLKERAKAHMPGS